jgi:hypothetical protein
MPGQEGTLQRVNGGYLRAVLLALARCAALGLELAARLRVVLRELVRDAGLPLVRAPLSMNRSERTRADSERIGGRVACTDVEFK